MRGSAPQPLPLGVWARVERSDRAGETVDFSPHASPACHPTECGSRLIRKGVGNRFFRQYGESLVTLLEAQPPPTPPAAAVWTAEHGHAWRQLFLDLRSYVAAGVSSGRPAASSPTLASSAAIVAAAWREHVADNVGDCGVKAYLAMFKNDPETLSVFFFKDSTNLAKDGRMREHVTKSFTVTGSMINLGPSQPGPSC